MKHYQNIEGKIALHFVKQYLCVKYVKSITCKLEFLSTMDQAPYQFWKNGIIVHFIFKLCCTLSAPSSHQKCVSL